MVGFSVSAMTAMLEKSGCLKIDAHVSSSMSIPAKGESKGGGKQE